MENIDIRLRLIEDRITNKEFLESKRIAGEVPFYIFDYPVEYELKVRDFVGKLTNKIKNYYRIDCIKLNLFQLYLEVLEDKGILDDVIERENEIGSEEIGDILINIVEGKEIAEKIGEKSLNAKLILLDGVGTIYPLVRTHSALNQLQPIFNNNDKPVLMFFPGTYTPRGLSLFDTYPADHYYRAFKLVEDDVSDLEIREVEMEESYRKEMMVGEEPIGFSKRKIEDKDILENLENLNLGEREIYIIETLKSTKELYEREIEKLLIKRTGKSCLISGVIQRINRKIDTALGIRELISMEIKGEEKKFIFNY